MQQISNLAIVTGASSGIGAAVACSLAAKGFDIALIARRTNLLKQIADDIQAQGVKAWVIPADLGCHRDRQWVLDQIGLIPAKIQVLVNNAGIGWYGYAKSMPIEVVENMIKVNVDAVVHFTLHIMNHMIRQQFGRIINVGSISGSLPSQGVAVYGATKAFMDNFSTALYRELHNTGVSVSVARIGPVRTDFCDTAANFPNGLALPTVDKGITADFAAQKIMTLIERPRRVLYIPKWLAVVPFIENSFGWLIDRLGPLLLKKAV